MSASSGQHEIPSPLGCDRCYAGPFESFLQMPEAARDLVRRNVNVIFAATPDALATVKGGDQRDRSLPKYGLHPLGYRLPSEHEAAAVRWVAQPGGRC